MFAGDFPHGLEEAELESNGLFADHGGGPDHYVGGLKFAFALTILARVRLRLSPVSCCQAARFGSENLSTD